MMMMKWLPRFNSTGRKTKRKKASASAKDVRRTADAGAAAPLHFGLREGFRYVAAFLALIGTGAGLWAWKAVDPLGQLDGYIGTRHGRDIDGCEILFAGRVSSVQGVEQALLTRAWQLADANPFDVDCLAKIQAAMADSGWMDPATVSVSRDLVTKSLDASTTRAIDRITIAGEFRQPFALIRRDDVDYLVDQQGTRLPVWYNAGTRHEVPVIRNEMAQAPSVGSIWPGRDITDGLLLIRFLREQHRPWMNQVRVIDVANADGHDQRRDRLQIITDKGYTIAWGRPVGEESGIEIPASEKVRVLDAWYESHGKVLGNPQGALVIHYPLITSDRAITMNTVGNDQGRQ